MKRKKLIIFSTFAVFAMIAAVASAWLFRVRYIDLTVSAADDDGATYILVDQTLQSGYVGKLLPFLSCDDVSSDLSKDPYVKVLSVKKIFPDRLKVEVERRVERYVISGDNYDYVTDDDFILLKKLDKTDDASRGGLINISVTEKDLSEDDMVLGKTVTGRIDGLFGSAVEIMNSFSDKTEFVASVKISGEFSYVRCETRTGVVVDFSFLPVIGGTKPDESEVENVKPLIVGKAKDAQDYYLSLDENKKRTGVVYVNLTVNGNVSVEWNAA